MKPEELVPYLKKFITVQLDDGTEDSGYVANPDAFKNPDHKPEKLVLMNGLFNSEVLISRIISVSTPVREDTLKIPIIGFDEELKLPQEEEEEEDMDSKIDALYRESLKENPEFDLYELLKDSSDHN